MERRSFVVATGTGLMGAGLTRASVFRSTRLRTPLCDLLSIEHPILQSGMGRVAGPELAAEVSRAGGLGILAGLGSSGPELRQQIQKLRGLTDRPFGVNLWLHSEIQPPADPAKVPDGILRSVQAVLNRFRQRLGLPESHARPGPFPDRIDEAFEVILEERVPVFSVGLGNPGPERVRRCHERGVKVAAMVATVEDARAVEGAGVDVIVVQGGEAGGHRSTWVRPPSHQHANIGTMTLVPQVVDAVTVPVVAAGGLADGRGLVAALALGAEGILLGTRFVATRESLAPEMWKRAILDASSDTTTVTDVFSGLPARVMRNSFTEEYAASGAPVLPALIQATAAQDIYAAAAGQGNAGYFPLIAGQSVGLIHDLPGAGDVVRALVREAGAVMDSLRERLGWMDNLPQ